MKPEPLTPSMSRALTFIDRAALLFGQWFWTGLSPFAPGTVGSVGAIPLFLLLQGTGWFFWFITAFTCIGGVAVSDRCASILGEKDPSSVVIDEVAGVLLALGPVQHFPWYFLVLAWVLFRVLDITKPWFIDRIQHLNPPGLGIMADDIAAGLVAGIAVWTVARLLREPFGI